MIFSLSRTCLLKRFGWTTSELFWRTMESPELESKRDMQESCAGVMGISSLWNQRMCSRF